MANGDTWGIRDGSITTLKQYATKCVRAFGVLVEFRDNPNAPMPEEFKVEQSYYDNVNRAIEHLEKTKKMTLEEAGELAKRDYEKECAYVENKKKEDALILKRYESMLKKVYAWNPPSTEYTELKNRMIESLVASIEHDCSPDRTYRVPKLMTPKKYLKVNIAMHESSLKSEKDSLDRQIEHRKKQNTFLNKLWASIKEAEA